MKKLIYILPTVFLAACLVLWVLGSNTREITTEVEISAPPTKVWSTLANISEWKEWSPVILDSKGVASHGSKLSITMVGKDGKDGTPGPTYEPTITAFEEPTKIEWRATMMGGVVMTNGKILELHETPIGTRVVHKETFSGIIVPLMWTYMENGVPPVLGAMNDALKRKIEADGSP